VRVEKECKIRAPFHASKVWVFIAWFAKQNIRTVNNSAVFNEPFFAKENGSLIYNIHTNPDFKIQPNQKSTAFC